MLVVDIVSDVNARINTGAAVGLLFLKNGVCGMSAGRSAAEALIAACTSRAAASILRLGSNCTAMLVVPSVLVEVSSVTLAISPRWRSSGAATVAAIVSGSALGRAAATRMGAKSRLGRLATGGKFDAKP